MVEFACTRGPVLGPSAFVARERRRGKQQARTISKSPRSRDYATGCDLMEA